MCMVAWEECNYVNSLSGTCCYYYRYVIIIIPNILISIGKQCLKAKEAKPEQRNENSVQMDRWMDEGAERRVTGPESSLEKKKCEWYNVYTLAETHRGEADTFHCRLSEMSVFLPFIAKHTSHAFTHTWKIFWWEKPLLSYSKLKNRVLKSSWNRFFKKKNYTVLLLKDQHRLLSVQGCIPVVGSILN